MKIIKINAIWCSGCLAMKKVWKQVLEEYPNLDIVNLDYDMDEDEVMKYNPGEILPVTIFKDGDREERLIGEKTKEEIIERLNDFYE